MIDKYSSFTELASNEIHGKDYRIQLIERSGSPVLIVAPHGGSIEVGTSELAMLIAGDEHSVFTFDGLKPYGRNRDLHITSHCFDHPECLALAARCATALGIHGCRGETQIYVGGLDISLRTLLANELATAGFPATTHGHRYLGCHPLNICNRGTRGRGAQLEITYDLRTSGARDAIAAVVRRAIAKHAAALLDDSDIARTG